MTVELASLAKVKLRVEDFDLLAENGGLAGLERTELLDGDIYLMAPQYRRHAFAKSVFYDALLDWARTHRPDLRVMSEASVAIPPRDEPIPDVILTSQPRGPKAIPVDSVLLLIEIADATLGNDLGYKAELYATAGVPEYWVADLQRQRVVRHAEPGTQGYGRIDKIMFGEAVTSVTLLELCVPTHELVE